MGIAYNVVSAGAVHEYPFAMQCLRFHGLASPALSEPGRNSSPQQLRTVLDALSGHATDYMVSPGNWQASVKATTGLRVFRSHTLITVIDYLGDETMPHLFYFDGGDPKLNILIVERLSRLCGPLFIFPDTGAQPLLVTPGIDPLDAVKAWEMR